MKGTTFCVLLSLATMFYLLAEMLRTASGH